MNVISKSDFAGIPAEQEKAPDGTEMVARVASERIRLAIADSGEKKALFMVVGLDARTTSAVALRIKQDHPETRVEIHPDLADDTLPPSMIVTESIGEYRNAHRESGRGAIVFAPPRRELDDVGKTAADIPQISEKSLVSAPELWISCCPNLGTLDERGRRNLINVLQGLAAADICDEGVRMFGAFLHRFDLAFGNMPFELALDVALPALRIPAGAGQFKTLGSRGKLPTIQRWAQRFRELYDAADEALYLRRSGAPLDRSVLLQRLGEMADEKPPASDADVEVLRALVLDRTIEPGQWRETQETAAQLSWTVVEKLFKRARKKAQEELGSATLTLFQAKMPSVLRKEDKELLPAVKGSGEQAGDAERDFFFRHRADIAEYSKALLKRWEAFVFRNTEQHADLALGLFMAIADLVDGTSPLPKKPRVLVRLHGADRHKFWAAHSQELCRFLRDRYRGLPVLFEAAGVSLDFGLCWQQQHPWDVQNGSVKPPRPTAKDFRFDIFLMDAAVLDDKAAPGGDKADTPLQRMVKQARGTTQFVWAIPMDSIASSFRESLNELVVSTGGPALLSSGRFSRTQNQDRSGTARILLNRRTSFLDASGHPTGVLVNRNDKQLDRGAAFRLGLAQVRGTILSEQDAAAIEEAFDKFEASYTEAVRALVAPDGRGLDDPSLLTQATRYGDLLECLRVRASKDDCRLALWVPVLAIGIAFEAGPRPMAICMPWHPFKLAGAAAKARRLADGLSNLMSGVEAADIRTFSRSIARTVTDGWHPAVALHKTGDKVRLLAETDQFADFALLEPPTSDQGADDAFDGFSEIAAQELLAVCDEYLELQPHERANFSVVLYNAENRSLPSLLAKELAAKVEQERDLRCDLILTHSDQSRLRQIYMEQNVAISSRLDQAMASEAAQGFLSRLRVGFIDLGGLGNTDGSVQAADIVFMHDVIARSARTSWRRTEAPPDGWKPFAETSPDWETRRRHFEMGTRKTEALLVPAERPLEVQRYLNILHDLHLGVADEPDASFVPVREIEFDGGGVKALIDQAHSIGDWVVTYDAIADAHLFRSNGVKIIRYVPRPDRDHSLVVSTHQPSRSLVLRLGEEIGRILGAPTKESQRVARICVEKASAISGRVVLRAARLENNALELLGLVLSRKVIEQSLDASFAPVCWLLLDDFAERLGHKGQKADILLICLSHADGLPTADLMVVESKFVSQQGESEAMVGSLKQMRATTNDLFERVVGYEDQLNRGTWLRRLADLLIEQGEFSGLVHGLTAQQWATSIRADKVRLRTSGLSMVFVHDRESDAPEPLASPDPGQKQHTFNRAEVREALRDIQASEQGGA